jgi:chemotaxis signal transduction protein
MTAAGPAAPASAESPAEELADLAEVELLVFELGQERYAADASQVLRIGRPGAGGPRRAPFSSPGARRAVVFRDPAADGQAENQGEGQLEVDVVLGVRHVPVSDLRRVPPVARASDFAIGFWLDGARPILLIDLPRTLARKAAT